MLLLVLTFIAALAPCHGLYSSSDDVIELTAANFNDKVVSGDEVWMVEFYAPWCGHCKNLAPEWKKAAAALKGVVKVGAVDMDVHGSVGGPYNVRGFPTIKIFGLDKKSPQDYQGQRASQGIIDAAVKAVKDMVRDRTSGRGSSGGRSEGGSGGGDAGDHVVQLTDGNFDQEVLNTKDIVLVEFFAPWCGHCQRLAPEWAKAAAELKGKVKVAALDATVNTVTASRFQVQGYPTIKFFPAGVKTAASAEDYNDGRTANDIVAWVLQRFVEDVDPPEIIELTGNEILKAECLEKPLCVLSVLPDILDTGATGRNDFISMLKEMGEKYKAKKWGWLWTYAGAHTKLQDAIEVGGFGFPTMTAINVKRKIFVTHKGGFSKDAIDETLKAVAVGRTSRVNTIEALPELMAVSAWNGEDGEPPKAEEEIDLSDVDLDDMDDTDDQRDEL